MDPNERRRNWMSRTQLAFNSGDLAFQEITTSRPNRNSATRVVSLDAVWPVTATFPSTLHYRPIPARFQGVARLRASIRILVRRLERRLRRMRVVSFGS